METAVLDHLHWHPSDAFQVTPALAWYAEPTTIGSGVPHTRALPTPVEVVSVALVADQLTRVDGELAALATAAAHVTTLADRAEARVQTEGIHLEVSRLMAMQLHRFLAQLRSEAEEEALALVNAARVEARLVRQMPEHPVSLFDARRDQWRALLDERSARAASPAPSAPPAPAVAWVADDLPSFEDDLAASDGLDELTLEPAAATDFWAADEKAPRWTRVRRHLTPASVLRGAAAVCVVVAVGLQVS